MMTEADKKWVVNKIKEWEQRLAEAKTEQEKQRAKRELQGYREWLHGYGNRL